MGAAFLFGCDTLPVVRTKKLPAGRVLIHTGLTGAKRVLSVPDSMGNRKRTGADGT